MSDQSTLQQLGTDAEILESMKTADPITLFFQLSKKIDDLMRIQNEVKEISEKTVKALFDPDNGIHGRVKSIEDWKRDLLKTVEEKIGHCRDTCMIDNGKVRMDAAEKSLEQVKKFQWLVFSAVGTTIVGLLFKYAFPAASAAIGS